MLTPYDNWERVGTRPLFGIRNNKEDLPYKINGNTLTIGVSQMIGVDVVLVADFWVVTGTA